MDWPHENEVLFQLDTNDYENNGCLTPFWDSLESYGENYKNAADTLIDAAIDGRVYVDVAVYPAVFMYRQYLELTLKDIIFRTRCLEGDGQGSQRHTNWTSFGPKQNDCSKNTTVPKLRLNWIISIRVSKRSRIMIPIPWRFDIHTTKTATNI